ncbi:hypothetical protein PBRA_008590 [Plasmodiophora brassicae]|nr:hypothetical protein PBRA_008590 [Plasmodiophora brassicae]
MQSIENYHFCDDPYAVCAEFFGTYIFLFATTLAVTYSGGQVFNIGTSYGLTLAVVIFITGPISGGHINPAVTFALTLHRILDWKMALYYVAAQLLGAVCGVATAYGISDELIGSIFVNERVSPAAGFFGEAIGTFVLVLTVYATAVHTGKGETSRTKEIHNGLAPFVIGLAVWAMHFSLVGVTGCGINPARFFGTAVVLNRWNGYEWVYIIGPLFGALMTFPVQKVLYRAASEASRDAADAECQDDQV